MSFPHVWNFTSTPQTATAPQLQAQTIPLFGLVRTMHRRRPEPITMPRARCPPTSKSTSLSDNDDNGRGQIPLPYHGPGNYTRRSGPPITPAPAPAPTPTPTSPVLAFLDTAFRTYTERIHTELAHLRSACTRVVGREQQEAERWRAHCAAVRRERDVARARVKVLVGEREGRGVASDGEDAAGRQSLRALRRSRSDAHAHARAALLPGAVKGSRSAPPPSVESRKKASQSLDGSASSRRSSLQSSRAASPSPASSSSASSATVFSDLENDPTLYHLAYPSLKLTALENTPPFLLPSNINLPPPPPLKRSHSAGPLLVRPPPGSASQTVVVSPPAGTRKQRPVSTSSLPTVLPLPTRAVLLSRIPAVRRVTLELEHVDLMFRSVDGQLECRACRLARDKNSSARVATFAACESWDELLEHCLMAHPGESRDVAGLYSAQVVELRRRLKEKDAAALRGL